MTFLDGHDKNEFQRLTLKDYFKRFNNELTNSIELNSLTDFLSNLPFKETKPYWTRRQIVPIDKRFSQIEIIYDDTKKIRAISWDIIIRFSQLEDMFGKSIIHNVPYDNSTEFAFKSNNTFIDIIKTRCPYWLDRVDGLNFIKHNFEDNTIIEILDPELSFIQISILE